jgi:hypothetical protein
MSKKLLSVILAIVVMASLCIVNASASANEKVANTGKIHAGDTVTFTASLKYGNDETDKLAAINATVTYDTNVLEIANVLKDIKCPHFGGTEVKNATQPGTILFNAAAGTNGFEGFMNGGELIVVTFNVKADADDTAINFSTEELFNVELDPTSGTPKDGKKDITDGCSATAAVECPHGTTTTDSEVKATDSEVKATDTEAKATDTAVATDTTAQPTNNNASPKTGDVATVAMMLVFAAAVVVLVSKKRA